MITDELFDLTPDRRGSGSVKWDTTPDGVIPMWVADMDFRTAPCIIDALRRRVDHGVFGYTEIPDAYYESLDSWFSRRHGYHISRSHVITVPGVVPAISATIKAFTKPGDGVVMQTPAYNCFFSSVRNNGCRLLDNPLRRIDVEPGLFTYEIDFEGLERAAATSGAKLLLLCNPHNPGGRAWTRSELLRVAEIADRYGLVLVSDEIHCDLTMPSHTFCSVASLPEQYASRAVVFNSPSKAFNTAGLQIANIIAPDDAMRAAIDRAVNDNEVCDVGPFGVTGLIAAYNHGEPWLSALLNYLQANYQSLTDFFHKHFPEASVSRLEATYLVWVDVSAYGSADSVAAHLLTDAKVRVASGWTYGDDRYLRFNIACSRHTLADALGRIACVGLSPK